MPERSKYCGARHEFNLRFPEMGLFYNYFRDYDPQTGRYVQSDPIGLAGGMNPYAYGDSRPTSAATAAKMLGGELAQGVPGAGAGGVAAIPLPSALDDCTCQR